MQYGEQCDSLSLCIISMVSGGSVQYGEQCDSLFLCIISMVSGGFVQYGEQCDSLSLWPQAVLCSMVSSVIHCLCGRRRFCAVW